MISFIVHHLTTRTMQSKQELPIFLVDRSLLSARHFNYFPRNCCSLYSSRINRSVRGRDRCNHGYFDVTSLSAMIIGLMVKRQVKWYPAAAIALLGVDHRQSMVEQSQIQHLYLWTFSLLLQNSVKRAVLVRLEDFRRRAEFAVNLDSMRTNLVENDAISPVCGSDSVFLTMIAMSQLKKMSNSDSTRYIRRRLLDLSCEEDYAHVT